MSIHAFALGRLHLVAAGELRPDRRKRHRIARRVARRAVGHRSREIFTARRSRTLRRLRHRTDERSIRAI
jgi:hypothetical protein